MEFLILGPLEVRDGDAPVALRGAKLRGLLAALLLRANTVVPSERLIDELWGDDPPETAPNTLQVYISQLRKALGPERLVTRPPGYLLAVDEGELDLDRFQLLAEEGRSALTSGAAEAAADRLQAALALWRGPALADVSLELSGRGEVGRLDELRIGALEDRIDAELALGRHAELVAELEALVAEHPVRERLRSQLMLALYRSGRQADALDEYRKARRALVDELGIEPGTALQRLERAILKQDSSLAAPVRERRRVGDLPTPPTPLVGRERELEEATALATEEDVRLVTFTGPGGIGKTRLALEVARELASPFSDGAFFVGLTPILDPSLVAPTIAKVLGATPRPGQSTEEALEQHLHERTLLLLLDNFEQVIEAAPLVARLLAAAPRLKVLVTSRAVLRLTAEHDYPVPPLELPELADAIDPAALLRVASAALFVQRAKAVDASFSLSGANARAVAELCARLDGLPLAIELAAARTKLMSPTSMLERLSSRLGLLTGGARDAPARQQTLRTTIDWSYDLLDETEQRLLARLAVFVGGFTLEAAEEVCGGDSIEVLEGLASLVDKSLLRRRGEAATTHRRGGDEPRFGMLELVREYASERLGASGEEDELRRRHAQHFVALAERGEDELHGSQQTVWLDRLEAEHDNLRAALAHSLEADAENALRLCGALRRFWQLHAHLAEGRRALESALAASREASPVLRSKALNGAGILAGEQGDFESAKQHFQQSLDIAREHGESLRVALALANLGNIEMFQGEYEQARATYEESLGLTRKVGRPDHTAVILENLGCVAMCLGDLDRATELFAEGQSLATESGDMHTIASAGRARARVLLLQGDIDHATELVEESLALTRELAEPHGLADCLDVYGGVAAARHDPALAAALFGAADALREQIGATRAPDHYVWFDGAFAAAKAELNEAEFGAAYERGRRLSLERALEEAVRLGAGTRS